MPDKQIGFIGLGAMGAGMAANLLKAGFAVTGFDIRAEAVDALKELGGGGASSPAEAVREAARSHHAMLLANHGPVVAGKSLDAAVYNAEELEETAKLFLMLRGCETRWLTEGQIAALREAFPN